MRRLGLALALGGCGKVPLVPVDAGFERADATWFEAEQTLFFFVEVHAEQGLGPESVLEVRWTTDDGTIPWTAIEDLDYVHTHLPVDCGVRARCASASVAVGKRPRDVRVRLRYHRDGALSLDPDTRYNTVDAGPDHESRSLLVYGVFDATNRLVQWRGRHQFPTLRNEEAEALGLRRYFRVEDPATGSVAAPGGNPYGYGAGCPGGLAPTGGSPVSTEERAVWAAELLPEAAGRDAGACATAITTDAVGEHVSTAIARKNPQVRPAFPVLRSPVEEAVPIKFYLGPCASTISREHADMLRQRLELAGVEETCTEGWRDPAWVDDLVGRFRTAVDAARPAGRDLVLVVALEQDEAGLSGALEEALRRVVPRERSRTTPRLAGAFVLDSAIRGLEDPTLEPVTLWCPANLDIVDVPDVSQISCAVQPDNPELDLGPFTFGILPILPPRDQYLDFIETYSERSAGRVLSNRYLVPEFSASARTVEFGEFGSATFLDDEHIDADPRDAFSWCPPDAPAPFVFSSPTLEAAVGYALDPDDCAYLGLDEDDCEAVSAGLLPIDQLPVWHETVRDPTYDLGVFWEFPFLLRMRYETYAAGAVGVAGLSVPFGFRDVGVQYAGAPIWEAEELALDALTQCDRFCDHPTFDSAGVYHPGEPFRRAYLQACYAPRYPTPADDGFPLDP